MDEKKFEAEKLYYVSISIARSMLRKGIIDEEVLAIIDTKLLETMYMTADEWRSCSGLERALFQ